MKNLVQQFDNLVRLAASQLTHPAHSTGDTYTNIAGPQQGIATPINLVESGDPVVCGRIVGVADRDALQSTDLITVYTKGVFTVSATIAYGGLSVGETCYINSSAVVSDDPTGIPFGVVVDNAGSTSGGLSSGTGTITVALFGFTPGSVGVGS